MSDKEKKEKYYSRKVTIKELKPSKNPDYHMIICDPIKDAEGDLDVTTGLNCIPSAYVEEFKLKPGSRITLSFKQSE